MKMEPVLYVEFGVNAQKFPSRRFWFFWFFPRNCYKLHMLNTGWVRELREKQLEREIHPNGMDRELRAFWGILNCH